MVLVEWAGEITALAVVVHSKCRHSEKSREVGEDLATERRGEEGPSSVEARSSEAIERSVEARTVEQGDFIREEGEGEAEVAGVVGEHKTGIKFPLLHVWCFASLTTNLHYFYFYYHTVTWK